MNKVRQYLLDVQVELKKASWPTQSEVKDVLVVVLVATTLLGIYVGIIDFIFSKLMAILMSY